MSKSNLQLLFRPRLLCSLGNFVHHLFELDAAVDREALDMRLLKEPQFIKGNDRIAFRDFEVKLAGLLDRMIPQYFNTAAY